MLQTRRSFLTSLGALIAAPAVIRTPGLLMPVKALAKPELYLWGDVKTESIFFLDGGPSAVVLELMEFEVETRRKMNAIIGMNFYGSTGQ